MKVVIYFVSSVSLICLAFVIGYGLWLLIRIPTRSWRESAFDYVFVNDDGSVRELQKEEEDKLSSLFFVGDEAEFYIKPRYESLNPSGRLGGYLKRRQLPRSAAMGSVVNS
jgi:hypothetical protein